MSRDVPHYPRRNAIGRSTTAFLLGKRKRFSLVSRRHVGGGKGKEGVQPTRGVGDENRIKINAANPPRAADLL